MSTECNEMAVKHCNEYLLDIQIVLEAHVLVILKALIQIRQGTDIDPKRQQNDNRC